MEPLWTPSSARLESSNLYAFQKTASRHLGREFETYADLHAWSVEDLAAFWAFYIEDAGLKFGGSVGSVMSGDPMPFTKWFEGATLNYAEQLLHPKALASPHQPALIAVTETGAERTLSYAELRAETGRCAAALKSEGVGVGDRVAAFATNTPETVVLLLACASLGAIFSSCSPDFGLDAAASRFGQVEPKLLFASPFYYYGGKRFETLETVQKLVEGMGSLERVVLLPYGGEDPPVPPLSPPLRGGRGGSPFVVWQEWLEPPTPPTFEQLPFDHPLYILFSSGTTGLPKAMVHRAGGALLKHHSEQHLHCDIKPGDRVFYFSTCGWMMWNWLVSALAQGAAVVQFEGSPGYPDLDALWRMAEKHGVTFFGTSARYLHTLQGAGLSPKKIADLSALRTVASTGSPLAPSGFEYVYDEIKEDVHLASISGGTDIVGCFMLGVPTEPVYVGQIQGPALGVDLVALSETGESVVAEPGELVCRQPLPSMPLKFLNDPDFERYLGAYFEKYPGLWRHGDLVEITPQGGVVVYGRSDATLNPGGVRIGTAELYRPLEAIPEIVDACAVGKRENGDETIWLFLVLKDGAVLDNALRDRVRAHIRAHASPRHLPRRVFQVSQLPRTRSGKTVEMAVSHLVNGRPVPNREVLANPEALDELASLLAAS